MPPFLQKRSKILTESKKERVLKALYLRFVEEKSYAEIAEEIGVKASTIADYCGYKYLVNEAKAAFAQKPSTTDRRKTTKFDDSLINWGNVAIKYEKTAQGKDSKEQSQKCYFFKFYDEKNHPIFTKIGTTINSCLDRLKQEIASYQKRGFAIVKVKICGIVDCGELPAEGLESFLRACFIRDYPQVFHKNDRFFDMDIPTEYFFTCAEYYFNTPSPYAEVTL
jgi:hypothetical protein